MGMLAMAGAISGMGQGLQTGLSNLQNNMMHLGMQKELSADERAYQTKKMGEQQTFEKGMAQDRFAHDERAATIKSKETLDAASLRYQQDRTLAEEKGVRDVTAAKVETIGKATASKVLMASQEKIHKATNEASIEVANIHFRAAAKTTTSSDIKELNHTLDTLETNITTLQKEANELIADPSSAAYKNIQSRLTLLQRQAVEARTLLNAKHGGAPPPPSPGGTKTISLENYAKAVAEKGQEKVDAYLKEHSIPIPSAKPAPGMLGTPSAGAVPDQTVPKLWSYEQK